jgi:hypothetical protein
MKKITIAKGIKVKRGVESKLKKKPGSGSVGKYKSVSSFAGPAGGSSKGSFPINTLKRARNALARAHFAPKPSGIRNAVYKKYPGLKSRALKRGKL